MNVFNKFLIKKWNIIIKKYFYYFFLIFFNTCFRIIIDYVKNCPKKANNAPIIIKIWQYTVLTNTNLLSNIGI